jgi:hypothetical protein
MPPREEDPVVRSARREALFVLVIWLAAMTYTVGYCYLFGYNRKIEDLQFVLGFPDWIFYGVIAPWGVCLLLSWIFSYVLMTDEDLGQDPDEEAGDA